jgi:hypothetical protein
MVLRRGRHRRADPDLHGPDRDVRQRQGRTQAPARPGAELPPCPSPASAAAVAPSGPRAPPPVGYVRPRHVAWAELLRRTFVADVLACPACGGRLGLVATIADPRVIARILAHLGLPLQPPRPVPPRPAQLAARRQLSAAHRPPPALLARPPWCLRGRPRASAARRSVPAGAHRPPPGLLSGADFPLPRLRARQYEHDRPFREPWPPRSRLSVM